MERFELFEYLGKRNDKEATIYRCGYYIVNRYCNKVESGSVSDTFYTIYDKIFLKIDVLLKEHRQYFKTGKRTGTGQGNRTLTVEISIKAW